MSSTGRNIEAHRTDALGAYDTPPELVAAVLDWFPAYHSDMTFLEPQCGSGNWIHHLLEMGHPPHLIEVMDVDPLAPGLDLARAAGCLVTPCAPARGPVECGWLVTAPQRKPDAIVGNPPYSVRLPPAPCPKCDEGVRVVRRVRETNCAKCEATGKVRGKRCGRCKGHGIGRFRVEVSEACDRCDGTALVQPKPAPVAERHVLRSLAHTARWVLQVLRHDFLGSRERRPLYELGHLRYELLAVPRPSFAWKASDSCEFAAFAWDTHHHSAHHKGGRLHWK